MTDDNNPYQSPRVPSDSDEPGGEYNNPPAELASRMSRLLASFIDGLVNMLVLAPVIEYLGTFKNGVDIRGQITVFLLAFLVIVLVHGYLLHTRGQSVGKLLVGIRIVSMDNKLASLGQIVFRRYLPVQLAGMIPGIGVLLPTIDVAWIFREDQRCLHDHLAGTKVVRVNRPV